MQTPHRAATSLSPGKASDHRLPRIDVLRAYAILLVIGIHLLIFNPNNLLKWKGVFRDYAGTWPFHDGYLLVPLTFGWSGVALFFVLSGFCIHYQTLTQTGPFRARVFFWRRFTRLYPAYFVSLLAAIAWNYGHNGKACSIGNFFAHLFLVHNFSPSYFTSINGVYWSLAVECQFYLLYPLLLRVSRSGTGGSLRRRWGELVVLNLVGIAFLATAFPGGGVHVDFLHAIPLLTWCDWVLGACLAEAYVEGRRFFSHPRATLVGSLLLLIFTMNFKPLVGESFLFASLFFAVVVDGTLTDVSPLRWRERALIPIGLVSYSLYLWHEPVLQSLRPWLGPALASGPGVLFGGWLLVALALILAVSVASYYLFEIGARRLLTRWSSSRASAGFDAPPAAAAGSRPA